MKIRISSSLTSGHAPWMICIFLVALIPRVYWATTHTSVIENEGAVYASLAENILTGRGYIAVFNGDICFNLPPLYPLLIAAATALVGDAEWGGRLASIVTGSIVIVPAYLAALSLYGPVVARIAASLFAVHPLLIGYSTAVYAETAYVLFLMVGLSAALRAQQLERYTPSAIAGAAFGLAYLTRVEAVLLPLATSVLIFLPNWRNPRRAFVACAFLILSFVAVASPYVAFLWAKTGSIRLEAKGPVFFLLLERMASGMSYMEAAYGLDADLVPGGPFLRSWPEMLQSTQYGLSDVLGYLIATSLTRLKSIFGALAGRATGTGLLILLACLGLFRTSWDRSRLAREGLVIAALACAIASLLMTQWGPTRYLLPLLAIVLLWAANGIQELGEWARGTIAAAANGDRIATLVASPLKGLLAIALFLLSLTGTAWEPELAQGWGRPPELATKEAGLWLRHSSAGSKTIMDVSSVLAFYAGGTVLPLPYCDAATALRYFASKKPEYIVLTSAMGSSRPYLKEWLREGIPDARATLIHEQAWDGGRIAVYAWRSH